MAGSIATLYGTLSLKTGQYDKAMRNASSLAQKFGRTILSVGGVIASAFAGRAMARAIKGNLDLAQSLSVTSKKLGVPVEQLQRLRAAAEEFSQMAAPQFDTALQRMTRRFSEAAVGTGEAKAAIKELNLDARRLSQLTPDEIFLRLADAMQDVEGQSDRVRLSFKLFDTEGVALANTLSAGRAGIDAVGDSYAKLGLIFNDASVDAGAFANVALARLGKATSGVGTLLSLNLALPLTAVANKFLEAAADSKVFATAGADSAGFVARAFISSLNAISDAQKFTFGIVNKFQQAREKILQFYSNHPTFLPKEMNLELVQAELAAIKLYTQAGEEELANFDRMGDDIAGRVKKIKEEITEGLKTGAGKPDDVREIELDIYDSTKTATDAAKELGMTFSSAFEDAIVGGEGLRDILKGLKDDVLRIFVRKTITEPLAGSLSGIFSGIFGSIFGGGRASGGSVFPDRAYIVGEEGPETFVPSRSGVVMPNGYGAGGGGGATVVNMNLNVSTGVVGTVRAEIVAMLPTLEGVAVAAVRKAQAQRRI